MIEKYKTKKQRIFKQIEVFNGCGLSYYPKSNPFKTLEKKHFVKFMGNEIHRNPNIILNLEYIKYIEKKQRLFLNLVD